jgi:peptidoglycan/LPS O-acetylase OafA/YrhL
MSDARVPHVWRALLSCLSWFAPPVNPHQNYRNLDGLRLIASVGIVLFHYNIYLADAIPYTRPYTQQFPYFVDLFFVISGIVIAMVYADGIGDVRRYGNFLSLRLARLYPLHLVTLLFYAAIGWLVLRGMLTVLNADRYDFHDFLPNLLLVHAWGLGDGFTFNYVSWSVSAEFFCYLTFPAILWLVRRPLWASAAALLCIVALAELVTALILDAFPANPDYNVSFVRDAVAGFSVGIFIYLHRARWARMFGGPMLKLCGNGVFFAMLASLSLGGPVWLSLGLVYFAVFLHFIADEAGVPLISSWRVFTDGSELTYSIYMLHTVVATVVVSFVFPRLFGHSEGVVVASLVVGLACTYVLAVAMFRGFENPVRRRWRKVSDRLFLAPRGLAKAPGK